MNKEDITYYSTHKPDCPIQTGGLVLHKGKMITGACTCIKQKNNWVRVVETNGIQYGIFFEGRWRISIDDRHIGIDIHTCLFKNTETGEYRQFDKGICEQKGEEYYLKMLNGN